MLTVRRKLAAECRHALPAGFCPAIIGLLAWLVAADAPSAKIEPLILDVGPQIIRPSTSVVTPHIQWAKPLAGGPLRVLFIDHQNKMREAVEFAQRLDLEFEFFGSTGSMNPYYLRGGHYLGDEPGAKTARLQSILSNEYDLIVMGNVAWKRFPEFARAGILEKLASGAGLLRISTGHVGDQIDGDLQNAAADSLAVPAWVGSGVPWQALPVFKKYDGCSKWLNGTFKASKYGRGVYLEITGYKPADLQIISPGFVESPLWHRWCDYWWVPMRLYASPHPDLDMPITDIKLLDYDYYLACLIKAMMFAAQRPPAMIIEDARPGNSDGRNDDAGKLCSLSRAGFTNLVFKVVVNDQRALTEVEAVFALRDRDNQIQGTIQHRNVILQSITNLVDFPVPAVPGGDYFADLWIKDKGATLGFGSRALRVTSDVEFKDISLGHDHFRVRDAFKARISCAIPATHSNLYLVVRQHDNHGRLVRRMSLPLRQAEFSLPLPAIENPLTVWQFLDFDIMGENIPLARRRVSYTLSDLYLTDAIRIGVWHLARMSYLNFHIYREYYRHGFDSTGRFIETSAGYNDFYGLGPHSTFKVGRFEMATLANLRFMPPIARIADYGTAEWAEKTCLDHEGKQKLQVKPNVRYPCVNDPEYVRLFAKRARDVVRHYGRQSTSEYFFDQEPSYAHTWARGNQDVCVCSNCVAYLRNYLRNTYKTIEALNQEYDTHFDGFDRVFPVTFDQVRTNRALAPQWTDFTLAMSDGFYGMLQKITDAIEAEQPGARAGIAAPIGNGFRSGDGADIWRASRLFKAYFPYPALTARAMLDFALPGALVGRGCWWGPARWRSPEFSRWHPWHDLFEGANFWYCYYGDTSELLAHDFSVYRDMQPRLDQFHEIKAGTGKLLHQARCAHPQIGILYSPNSIHYWTLSEAWGDVDAGTVRYGQLCSEAAAYNYAAWINLLADALASFRFISREELQTGYLEDNAFQMLVLPWCQAMSPPELAAVKNFVRRGGVVLADLRPGVGDEHCKPYDASPLDEVFGVVQNTHTAKVSEITLDFNALADNSPAPSGVTGGVPVKVDLSLKVDSGAAAFLSASGAPLAVRNSYGDGRGILLNFAVENYLDWKQMRLRYYPVRSQSAPVMKHYFHELLTRELGPFPVRLNPALDRMRCYQFEDGVATYLGLLREPPEFWEAYSGRTAAPLQGENAVVRLLNPSHVYDVRRGAYAGFTDNINVCITACQAEVFACLPYQVEKIKIDAAPACRPGQRLNFKLAVIAGSTPGRHVIRVELINPEGQPLKWYTRLIDAANGRHTGDILLAINEQIGNYTVAACDIATGVRGTAAVTVAE